MFLPCFEKRCETRLADPDLREPIANSQVGVKNCDGNKNDPQAATIFRSLSEIEEPSVVNFTQPKKLQTGHVQCCPHGLYAVQ